MITNIINNPNFMKSFHMVKKFSPEKKDDQKSIDDKKLAKDSQKFNNLSFSDSGLFLAASNNDETIYLYDIQNGKEWKKVFSKKYGVDKVNFTHNDNTVICASKNNKDHTIRYLDLKTNSYIRYFRGHQSPITSLKISKKNDTFCSASDDGRVYFWDLKSNTYTSKIDLPHGNYLNPQNKSLIRCCYDDKGLIVGIGCAPNVVSLYDVKKLGAGPFATWMMPGINRFMYYGDSSKIPPTDKYCQGPGGNSCFFEDFVEIELQPVTGRYLNVTTTKGFYFYDSLAEAKTEAIFYACFMNDFYNTHGCSGSFSPDGNFFSAADQQGIVHTWDLNNKQEVARTPSWSTEEINFVKWNPNFYLFATANSDVGLWTPQ